MCGRFTLTVDPSELQQAFPWVDIPTGFPRRYNIAPSQPIAVIANDGQNKLDFVNWGLIPSWAKDPAIGNRMINARSESLAEKPSFRAAYRRRRCLIPSDGFYEWHQDPGSKQKTPMYITRQGHKIFAFAGLWEEWHSNDGSFIRSATILTTSPNSFMKKIHNRMPVILEPENYAEWLSTAEKTPASLDNLLVPYPGDDLQAYAVSTIVNSPGNEVPACIEPV